MESYFKYIVQAHFAKDFLGKSKGWLTQKIKGIDPKGGFDVAEKERLAAALDRLGDEFKARASEIRALTK